MNAVHTKKTLPPFPRAKITRIVEGILPKGKTFKILTTDSGIRQMKVVRIVTPAWKELRPPERIGKVLAAMHEQLSNAERDRILRFSVLTQKEYNDVVLSSPVTSARKAVKNGRAKKLTAKRKAVRKS